MPAPPPSDPHRLGVHWTGSGIDVTVASSVAEGVELCLFGEGEEVRVELSHRHDDLFSAHLPGIPPGTPYGLRVHGPWDPGRGLLCNPAKLLVDPYARLVTGEVEWVPAVYPFEHPDSHHPNRADSAPFTLRSVVVDPSFDWGDDHPPGVPLADTLIYETHVKGMTMRHPAVPAELRGTYAGLAHPEVIGHLQRLGVTAVELLPVQRHVTEPHLAAKGLTNYWGYNTIGFFSPHPAYAAGPDPVAELKHMVRALHAAGIEVILDVVYNHTAEGDHRGPVLSFKGLDNPAWYRLNPTDRGRYLNWTGTGNTLDITHPTTLRMVMDSLRHWVEEYRVDGFRFDLAVVLARGTVHYDRIGGFLQSVAQDPVLQRVKLISEPWDVGPDGYRVGEFPRRWSEWNDRYRDTVRDFWRHQPVLADFATRITGSSDIYEASGRSPTASVNFVTSHDGFTLSDLVSYNERHNRANREDNRDGHPDNRSWNSGVEGPTDDREVMELRHRRRRSLITTLLVSQGIPMLLGGDELGRTQGGNNNAYCQDNEVSWFDWEAADPQFVEFVAAVARLRRAHPTFRRPAWLHEHPDPGGDHVGWFTPQGGEMTPERWRAADACTVTLYLDGAAIHTPAGVLTDDDFLLMFNGSSEAVTFHVPPEVEDGGWTVEVDTGRPTHRRMVRRSLTLAGYGMAVLRRRRG